MSELRRKKQTEREQYDTPHPLAWVRTLLGPLIALGGWGVIGTSFIVGVVAIYVGLGIAFFEFALDPLLLRKRWQLQVFLMTLVLFLFDVFTIGVVAARAPLNFATMQTNIDYSGGQAPAGIAWRPFYGELDLIITNPTDENYSDFNAIIQPDLPVAEIRQLSNLPDCSFEDRYGTTGRITVDEKNVPNPRSISLELLATDVGYRVHCGYIPPRSSLRLIMAVVNIKKRVTVPQSQFTLPSTAEPEEVSVEQTMTENGITHSYWFGSRKNLNLFLPHPVPKTVAVSGTYKAHYSTRNLSRSISIEEFPK